MELVAKIHSALSKTANSTSPSWLPPWKALLPPGIACLVISLCWPWLQSHAWLLFYPAVFASSLIGGLRGGLWATALSVLLVEGMYCLADTAPGSGGYLRLISAAVFICTGVAFSLLQQRLRTSTVQQAEARFASIVGSAMDAIISVDAGQKIVLFNAAAEAMFHCPAADALGQSLERFMPERFREGHLHHVQDFGCTGVTTRSMHSLGTLSGLRANGDEFPIEASISQIEVAGQKTFTVILRDITERKQAEDLLRQSEERFRLLTENIQEVYWVTDVAKLQMHYVSPAYETLWGLTCESLYASPQSWMDAIHPDDRAQVQGSIVQQSRGTYDQEYRITRPDGSLRWIHDRAFPVRDAHGAIYRIVGVARDVSERKAATLLETARDAILVGDLDHRITYWNKGAERLYGWSAPEAQGRLIPELLHRGAAPYLAAAQAVVERGEWTGELRQVNKVGGSILIEARWTLVRDADGRPQSILAINTDITEKKKVEQQLLRAQRMESIGTLAGGIAHDLNNMLAPIMLSIDLLKMRSSDERSLAVLATIESSARRGAEMVQQILCFSRGVEGRRMMIDPRSIIQDMGQMIQDTFPKNIEFRASVIEPLPSFPGDHTQVHQVLLNLCVNARDAMPAGGRLSVSAYVMDVDLQVAAINPGTEPGTFVAIKVEDTGTGIPQEVQDRIFDPFFTTKELGKGTGLGLSTALAIVRSHGGFINLYSEPGQGTTFTVCFPVAGSASCIIPEKQEQMHPRGNGELVLLVDDESAVRTITQQTLETYGYRVLVAADGVEAAALYSRHVDEISVVLTDMMMPVMDGPAAIEIIKQLNPKAKIIASSGLANEGVAARASAMEVKHLLLKPYTAQQVLTILQEVLGE